MIKKLVEGFYLGIGFILILVLFFGIVFAVGFHSADEILEGTFVGNYIFEDNVTFNGIVSGLPGSSGGGIPTIETFTSDGTFTVPENITEVLVLVVGGGGSGAWSSSRPGAGGGGGSGGWAYAKVDSLISGTSIPITIGAGGSTSAGGSSSFGTYVIANGGNYGDSVSTSYIGTKGGSPGTVSISGATIIMSGGDSGYGGYYNVDYPANSYGGTGGSGIYGIGGLGMSGGDGNGVSGSGYGSGGGGLLSTDSLSNSGGNGRSGVVVVMYY